MKLWLISQDENRDYDTYDSAVVAAETEEEARSIHPGEYGEGGKEYWVARPDQVKVTLLGEAISGTDAGIIVASFNAR